MDMSSGQGLSDPEMEDAATMIDEYQMMMMMMNDEEGLNNCFEFEFEPTDYDHMLLDNNKSTNSGPANDNHQLKINDVGKSKEISDYSRLFCPNNSSPTSNCDDQKLISFGSSSDYHDYDDHNNIITDPNQQKRMSNKRSSTLLFNVSSQQHVIAERKRREIMNQSFIALSALIPHPTKKDKVSILGDATKYVKEMEERVKLLEEKTSERRVESVVLVKKRQQDDCCSNDDNLDKSTNSLLEIEARISNNNVLIRIHCRNHQGLVQKVLNEIEKLHLTTVDFSATPFGGYATHITIIARMNDDLCMTMENLVMHLKLALQQFFNRDL